MYSTKLPVSNITKGPKRQFNIVELQECVFLIQSSDNKSLKCEINNYDVNF